MGNYFDLLGDIFALAPGKKLKLFIFFTTDIAHKLVTLLPPVATSGIIALLTEKREFSGIWFYVFLYLIFYIIQFAILEWNYRTYVILSHHYYGVVQQSLFEHVVENDGILGKISKGKIIDTCSEDVSCIVYAVNEYADIVAGGVLLLGIFVIFALNNIIVALAALLIDMLYLYLMVNNSRMIAKHYEGTRKYQDRIMDVLNQMLSSLRQVKTLNLMPNLTKRLDKSRRSYDIQYDKKYEYINARYCRIPMIIYVGKIILYICLAGLVSSNEMRLDTLVLLISYFEMVISSTNTILEQVLELSHNEVRINRIKHILNFTNETAEIEYGDVDNDYINGVVTFDHVNCEIKNQQVLKNVSFKALPNEITAIVGRPGAGKTTIMNLLYRLVRVKSGSILIDDESIYNYTKHVYSSNVSGVFQRSLVFKMSIRDNLSLVDSNLKNQIAAMKRVGVYNEIEKLPYGINTIIDESNMMLTDGQLKKLAIARALLTKAEILLFDEVTSSVDPATTNDILRILKDLREDHTILIVTHKAEIMELSDQVIVLDRGRVAAKGRNTEVFEKSALYRELRTHTVSEPSVNAVFSEKPTDDDGGYINECEDSDIQEAKEARLS